MKFSNEAMRDVLMFFEEKITYKYDDNTEQEGYTPYLIVENDYFTELFSKHKYTKDELAYTIEKMVEVILSDNRYIFLWNSTVRKNTS